MRNPLVRDVPPRAAFVVVALALLASVVTGRERAAVPEIVEPEQRNVAAAPVPVEDLDVERLVRLRREEPFKDLFASRSMTPPPAPAPVAAAKPAPPPAPSAPPLPFRYLGRMVDGGKVVVFLLKNQDTLHAAPGDTLENAYKVESVTDSAVHFVYLPLGTKQALSVPAPQ